FSANAAEKEPQLESLRLSSGRRMSYRQLGSGDRNLILIHGFPGSSRQFLSFNKILQENGISALAPNLYGEQTDWNKRSAVIDTGRDIAELFHVLRGKNSKVVILCVSAGAKDGIATTVALNSRKGG